MTMSFYNYPWSIVDETYSNSSKTYLSAHVNISTFLYPCINGTIADNRNASAADFSDGKQRMAFSFEKGFLIDGVPFTNNQTYDSRDKDFVFPCEGFDGIPLDVQLGIALCNRDGFGNWDQAVYDPQLVSIFLVDDQTNNKSTKPKYPLIVGMVFLGVILLTIGAVGLILLVPALHKTFMPSHFAKKLTITETIYKAQTASPRPESTAVPKTSPSSSPTPAPKKSTWKASKPTEDPI